MARDDVEEECEAHDAVCKSQLSSLSPYPGLHDSSRPCCRLHWPLSAFYDDQQTILADVGSSGMFCEVASSVSVLKTRTARFS